MSYHTFHTSHDVQLLLPPADQGDLNTSWVAPFANGGGANAAVFMLVVGTVAADAIDLQVYQATDSSGTGAKVITGAAITQITTTTDECVKTIEIFPWNMDDVNGFKYVRANVTVAGAGTENYTVLLIKHQLRQPGNFTRHSSYTEYVSL